MPYIQFHQYILLIFIFAILVSAYLCEDIMYMWVQVATEPEEAIIDLLEFVRHHPWALETVTGSHTRAVL